MASRTSTPQSRSRSSSGSSSDITMIDGDVPPQSPSRPVRLRNISTSHPSTTGPTTAPDPTFSLLLSLPRELRERIYRFALTSPSHFWWPNPTPVKNHVSVNLLRASRQVRQEATPILYAANKFLFTHPSDCNIFHVVAASASHNIQSVYFRIREKDLRLWTSYLGSKSADRSLRADLPRLKNLWIFLKCGSMGMPAMLGQMGAAQGIQAGMGGGLGQGLGALPPGIQMQVQAVQNALGQQVQALQQQVQNLTHVMANAQGGAPQTPQLGGMAAGNQVPPPPPPPPTMPFIQFAQGGLGLAGHGHGHHHHHPAPPLPHQHGTQNNPPNPGPLAQHLAHTQQANGIPPPPTLHHAALAPVPGQIPPQNLVPGPQHQHQHQHQHHPHHPHTLYATFLRFEREIGLESLCLSLHETLRERSSPQNTHVAAPPEVKIVCIMRIPRREVDRLLRLYPDELTFDPDTRNARTKFRRLHGVEVSLEISGGYVFPGEGGGGGEVGGDGMVMQG